MNVPEQDSIVLETPRPRVVSKIPVMSDIQQRHVDSGISRHWSFEGAEHWCAVSFFHELVNNTLYRPHSLMDDFVEGHGILIKYF